MSCFKLNAGSILQTGNVIFIRKVEIMNKKQVEGYFSVEAALVLPIVLGVYLFLIVLLFVQHDRCLLEQDMASMMLKAVNHAGTPKQQLDYLQELTAQWDRGQYLWIKQQSPHFTIQGQKIRLEAAGEYTMPVFAVPAAIGGVHRLEVTYQITGWDRVRLAQWLAGKQTDED